LVYDSDISGLVIISEYGMMFFQVDIITDIISISNVRIGFKDCRIGD
jgi:hypothetical protein